MVAEIGFKARSVWPPIQGPGLAITTAVVLITNIHKLWWGVWISLLEKLSLMLIGPGPSLQADSWSPETANLQKQLIVRRYGFDPSTNNWPLPPLTDAFPTGPLGNSAAPSFLPWIGAGVGGRKTLRSFANYLWILKPSANRLCPPSFSPFPSCLLCSAFTLSLPSFLKGKCSAPKDSLHLFLWWGFSLAPSCRSATRLSSGLRERRWWNQGPLDHQREFKRHGTCLLHPPSTWVRLKVLHRVPGVSWWLCSKEPTCQCRRHGVHPWVRKTS